MAGTPRRGSSTPSSPAAVALRRIMPTLAGLVTPVQHEHRGRGARARSRNSSTGAIRGATTSASTPWSWRPLPASTLTRCALARCTGTPRLAGGGQDGPHRLAAQPLGQHDLVHPQRRVVERLQHRLAPVHGDEGVLRGPLPPHRPWARSARPEGRRRDTRACGACRVAEPRITTCRPGSPRSTRRSCTWSSRPPRCTSARCRVPPAAVRVRLRPAGRADRAADRAGAALPAEGPRTCRATWPARCGSTTPTSTSPTTCAAPRCPSRARTSSCTELVARLMSRPLDHTRPLWEMYLVEGLARGPHRGPDQDPPGDGRRDQRDRHRPGHPGRVGRAAPVVRGAVDAAAGAERRRSWSGRGRARRWPARGGLDKCADGRRATRWPPWARWSARSAELFSVARTASRRAPGTPLNVADLHASAGSPSPAPSWRPTARSAPRTAARSTTSC